MDNKWICLKCDATNDKPNGKCLKCHASRHYNGVDAVEIDDGGERFYVKKPAIWRGDEVSTFLNKKDKLSKCPSCKKIMFYGDRACPHCRYLLSKAEWGGQEVINVFGKMYYLKSTIIWCFIVGALMYFLS